MNKNVRLATLAIHAGETPDPATRASSPNLVMSTTYVTESDAAFSAEDFGANTPFIYTRWGNPTIQQLEQKLAALEGAEAAIAFASGMAASTGLLLQFLKPGDHLVISDVSYAGVAEFAKEYLPAHGIEVSRVDLSQPENLTNALRSNTRLVYAETPANPILKLTDIAAIAEITHNHGAKLIVDSTFATPVATRPLALGADFVVHSLTKYIGGHGDAIGGAVLGKTQDLAILKKDVSIHLGGIISPFNAWLILRGLATLPIRMRAHEEGAIAVAHMLEQHPNVKRVIYPGLESHPQSALARKQMKNFSGMMSFQVKGVGQEVARNFSQRLQIIHYAVSLGHHRSLVFYLSTQEMLRTSFALSEAQEATYRSFAGDGIFRLSVGLENPEDLIEDLERALK